MNLCDGVYFYSTSKSAWVTFEFYCTRVHYYIQWVLYATRMFHQSYSYVTLSVNKGCSRAIKANNKSLAGLMNCLLPHDYKAKREQQYSY